MFIKKLNKNPVRGNPSVQYFKFFSGGHFALPKGGHFHLEERDHFALAEGIIFEWRRGTILVWFIQYVQHYNRKRLFNLLSLAATALIILIITTGPSPKTNIVAAITM
ncbi:hypothetical protein AQ505_09530 [Pedobacter sp. PACM 27299]|nr:hypothetical protein AQ505_09530 [Pedobacter sp. PACM 27299]